MSGDGHGFNDWDRLRGMFLLNRTFELDRSPSGVMSTSRRRLFSEISTTTNLRKYLKMGAKMPALMPGSSASWRSPFCREPYPS